MNPIVRATLFAASSLLLGGCATRGVAPAQRPFEDRDGSTGVSVGRWNPRGIEASLDARKPSDFAAFRISGSFRNGDALLTERIVLREGAVVVVDYTFADATSRETLRVSYDLVSGDGGEVFDVSVVTRGGLRPAPAGAYETMMAKTRLVADRNEGLLFLEKISIEIGGKPLLCERASWLVSIGSEKATLRVTDSQTFAWGNIAGEIRTLDGAVVYRAELIEVGESDPSRPIFVEWDPASEGETDAAEDGNSVSAADAPPAANLANSAH